MKYTYSVESHFLGSWRKLFEESRDFCLGFLDARKDQAPRNAYRLTRSDGKVIVELPATEDVSIGMIAGWPTAEQYEFAAQRALVQAARIRAQTAKEAARQG